MVGLVMILRLKSALTSTLGKTLGWIDYAYLGYLPLIAWR